MIFEQEKEFNKFREENKHLRFFEALKEFAEVDAILLRKGDMTIDTIYYQDIKPE